MELTQDNDTVIRAGTEETVGKGKAISRGLIYFITLNRFKYLGLRWAKVVNVLPQQFDYFLSCLLFFL